jgi:hypothetical protein
VAVDQHGERAVVAVARGTEDGEIERLGGLMRAGRGAGPEGSTPIQLRGNGPNRRSAPSAES